MPNKKPPIHVKAPRTRIIAISQKIKWTIHFIIRRRLGHFRARMVASISWKTHTWRVQNCWLVGAQHGLLVKFSSSSKIFNWTVPRLVASDVLAPVASIWMISDTESDTSRLQKNDCQLQLKINHIIESGLQTYSNLLRVLKVFLHSFSYYFYILTVCLFVFLVKNKLFKKIRIIIKQTTHTFWRFPQVSDFGLVHHRAGHLWNQGVFETFLFPFSNSKINYFISVTSLSVLLFSVLVVLSSRRIIWSAFVQPTRWESKANILKVNYFQYCKKAKPC